MEIIRFCFTFFAMMMQIYMVCAHGEQLQKKVIQICIDKFMMVLCDKSNELIQIQSLDMPNGIYSSAWYERSISYQRSLLIMMVRSQRIEQLYIYKFGAASMLAFSSVDQNFCSDFISCELLKFLFAGVEQCVEIYYAVESYVY